MCVASVEVFKNIWLRPACQKRRRLTVMGVGAVKLPLKRLATGTTSTAAAIIFITTFTSSTSIVSILLQSLHQHCYYQYCLLATMSSLLSLQLLCLILPLSSVFEHEQNLFLYFITVAMAIISTTTYTTSFMVILIIV
jgi:hypothetical protein